MTGKQAPATPSQRGLTLIELMISLTILSIAIAAALTFGYQMINSYRDSRQTAAVERAARGALGFLTNAVRSASPGVETGNIADFVGCNTWQGLAVVNSMSAPDEVRVVYAAGAVVTSLRTAITQTSTVLDVVDGSQFSANDLVVVANPGISGVLLKVSSVTSAGGWKLNMSASPRSRCSSTAAPHQDFALGLNSLVIRAKLGHFFVDNAGGLPMLMMDPDGIGAAVPVPIAEGIEDLQVAVGVDNAPADDQVVEIGAAANDDEWRYNRIGDTAPPTVVTTPWRAIRMTVIARTFDRGTQFDGRRPALEDRIAATAPDQHRRRILSATAEIRNLRGSP